MGSRFQRQPGCTCTPGRTCHRCHCAKTCDCIDGYQCYSCLWSDYYNSFITCYQLERELDRRRYQPTPGPDPRVILRDKIVVENAGNPIPVIKANVDRIAADPWLRYEILDMKSLKKSQRATIERLFDSLWTNPSYRDCERDEKRRTVNRTRLLKEDLIVAAWSPERLMKWLDRGYDPDD